MCLFLFVGFFENEGIRYSILYTMAGVSFICALVFCFLDDKKKTKDDNKKE